MGVSEKNEKVLENIARPKNRSPLFWWMLERHDEIVEFAVGWWMDWKGFIAGATELGITDTLGRPVKERNARETWRQVRLEKARLEEWRAENEAARAVKEAERLARRRIRSWLIWAENSQTLGTPRAWPAPIVVGGREASRSTVVATGLPAKVAETGGPMTKEEYLRRRNARGADGFLTDEAIRLRDRELKTSLRGEDLWMALTYKDDEK